MRLFRGTVAAVLLASPLMAQTPAPTVQSVSALVSQQRFSEALPEAQTLVKANAADPAAHNLLGQCLLRADKPDSDGAIKEFGQAVTLDAKNAGYQRNLGNAHMAKFWLGLGDWVNSHNHDILGMVNHDVPTVLGGGSNDEPAILFTESRINDRSMSQMDPGDWVKFQNRAKDAQKAYAAALALDATDKASMRGKGLTSLVLGDWKDTAASWKAGGVPIFDSFIWEIARNVNDARTKGPESIEIWEMVSASQPDNAWAYWYLRDLYDEFHHSDWHFGYYDAMRMLYSDQIRNESDAKQPSPKDALRGLKEVTDKHPDFGPAWRGTGMALLVLKDKKAAEAAFEKAAAVDPADWFSNFTVGVSRLDAKKPEDALPFLSKAAKLHPDDARVWHALGMAAEDSKDMDSAEMYYGRAVELAPNWADAQFGIGSVLLERRAGAEALPHLQRYIELAPKAKNVKDVTKAIEQLKEILAKEG